MKEYTLCELKIEVTHRCPLTCIHCSSSAGSHNTLSIDLEKCRTILQDAATLGVKSVAFSGGEPLVWPNIEEMIRLCSDNSIVTSIYTSGNTFDGEYPIDVILPRLRHSGLAKAIFSLYSDQKDEHNRITRKVKSYDSTLEAIRLAKKLGLETQLHFVALASNYKKFRNIVSLGKTLGIDSVSVLRFVPQGRGRLISDKDTLSQKQNIELQVTVKELQAEGYLIRTGSPLNVLYLNKEPKCMAARDRMIISPDLSVYPCDAFKQIKAHNITETVVYSSLDDSSLADCWNHSSYFNKIREVLDTPPSPPCKDCKVYGKCASGCLAQKFLEYGDLYKNPDPACLIRKV